MNSIFSLSLLLTISFLFLNSLGIAQTVGYNVGENLEGNNLEIIEYVIDDLRKDEVDNSSNSNEKNNSNSSLGPLLKAYPNPSNELVSFQINFEHQIKNTQYFNIYSSFGQLIRSFEIISGTSGTLQILWDGNLKNGGKAPPGVYFYSIQINNQLIQGSILRF